MRITATIKRRILPVTAGLAVIGLAAGGVAYATTPSVTASPASTSIATAAASLPAGAATGVHLRQDLRWLVRHTVHAQLIVRTAHGYTTIDLDRGTLSSVSSDSITIVRPDGPSVTATLTSATRYFGLPKANLASGDRVVLVQGGGGKALIVASRAPTSSPGGSS